MVLPKVAVVELRVLEAELPWVAAIWLAWLAALDPLAALALPEFISCNWVI